MTKSARYSTFKEPSIRGSWTTGKIASNWLLACCCGPCYARQKTASTSESNGEKIPKSVVESQIPSKTEDDGEGIVMEEVLLKDHDHRVSKNDAKQDVVEDGTSLINRKNGSSDSKSKSSSASGALSNGTRRVIGSLPSKEKKSASFNDEKNVSESDSEIEHPGNIFAKCSKRYRQQRAINVPQLIIS